MDFNNQESLGWKIIHYISNNLKVEANAKILDIGCGSGTLSIDCAKKYPQAKITGIDRWDSSYKSLSKNLCEENAKAENISNIEFIQYEGTKLPFEKESFDALTSNFIYQKLPENKQDYIIEVLTVLKKGGSFAILDLFVDQKYGNLDMLITNLKNQGYQKVELLNACTGKALTKSEAKTTLLKGCKLLVGIK